MRANPGLRVAIARIEIATVLSIAIAASGCGSQTSAAPGTPPHPSKAAVQTDEQPKPVPQDPRRAFLSGYNALHANDAAYAADCLSFAAGHDSALADYALYYLSVADRKLGRDPDAEAALRRLTIKYPQSVWRERAELTIAEIELKAGNAVDASAIAARIVGATRDQAIEQDARLLLARALEASGDPRGAYEQLETFRNKYPRGEGDSGARALERSLLAAHPEIVNLETLDYRRAEADLLVREGQTSQALAQIDAAMRLAPQPATLAELKLIEARAAARSDPFRARRALTEYLAIAPEGPAAPMVLDKLARIDWNADDTNQARVYFRRLVREFPSSPQAPEAMFAIGRTFEDDGDLQAARAQYDRTYARYPSGENAFEARFRAAFTLYMSGEYQAAARRFGAIGERIADGSDRDMTLYWRARALENSGEEDRARAIYQPLALSIDSNYYPALASARVGARPDNFPAALAPDPAGQAPDLTAGDAGFHLTRALALRALDLKTLETAELKVLETHAEQIPALRGFVLASYQDAGAWHDALAAAVRMEERGEISREVAERLRYPRAYWTLIDPVASRRDLDPYLVLALTRQESLFDPAARSSSDARGLMQLMAPTARRVAGASHGGELDLYDPATSVELGSSYLRQLLDQFGGDRVRAVAAYNAGEHAVANWNAKFPGDDDQWVENIGYRETRDYVKKVIGGVREYQLLYQTQPGSRLSPPARQAPE